MSDQQKKVFPINYTNREFESIRSDLMQLAERFYPETFQDFSEASFGSIMVDSVAYVADQLSFYLDYNINESFLDTAYQFDNVLRHGRILGYKSQGRPSTYGTAALYVVVPASQTGLGPDAAYIPIMKRGSRFTSTTGLNYVLTENVDFADSLNPVVVAQMDPTTGAPTHFAIKSYGTVVSGYFSQETIPTGAYERFKTLKLTARNVSEIISVYDSDGNEYYEVDYLAQDMIYKELGNSNYKNDNIPSILKPYLVSRKFVVERTRNDVFLQFGSGDIGATNVVAQPQNVAMDIFGKDYVSDTTFDPTRLTKNQSFGIVPANTNLTITYRITNPANSNLATGGLTEVSNAKIEFEDRNILTTSKIQDVISSIEVYNEEPIVGNVSNASSGELKRRVYDTFPTQNRAVTQADYENIAYRMPSKYGSIKRCSVQRDPNSQKRNLNMYIVAEDSFGKLTIANSTIKSNLKTWLNHYRMMNDTIDVVDPYIINLGVDFLVKTVVGSNKYEVLDACVMALKELYKVPYFIGEPIYITDIYARLKDVEGVLDVVKVKLVNKNGTNYSGSSIDINQNLSPDGTYLIVPKNAIVEIKYPDVDIKGRIR